MAAVAGCSALARKNDYKIDYNREIVGLGVANFFGAAFNCYTTTGSFSRCGNLRVRLVRVQTISQLRTPHSTRDASLTCPPLTCPSGLL